MRIRILEFDKKIGFGYTYLSKLAINYNIPNSVKVYGVEDYEDITLDSILLYPTSLADCETKPLLGSLQVTKESDGLYIESPVDLVYRTLGTGHINEDNEVCSFDLVYIITPISAFRENRLNEILK